MKEECQPGKALLEQIRELDRLRVNLKRQIEQEEAMLMDISVRYREIQVQSSGARDLMSEKVPEIIDLESQLVDYMREIAEKKQKAFATIKKMKDIRWQQLLLLHYIQGLTLERTAEAMDKSYTWTWQEMQQALKDFEIIFESV